MQIKLDTKAQNVIVTRTVSRVIKTIEGVRGPRKLYSNTTVEVCRFPLNEGPSETDLSSIDDVEQGLPEYEKRGKPWRQVVLRWVGIEKDAISIAYQRDLKRGLVGGTPVVKQSQAQERGYYGNCDLRKGRRVGEFLGIINGARKLETCTAAIKRELREPAEIANSIQDEAKELLEAIAVRKDRTPAEALTEEEQGELYKAERLLFYLLTQGLGLKQNWLESKHKEAAIKAFRQLKEQCVAGKILGSSRLIREIIG